MQERRSRKTALEIFRLIGSIFVDTDKAEDSLSKTDEKAQGLGKTLIKGVGTAAKWAAGVASAAVAVGTAVVAGSTKAVSAYSNYEQAVGGIETLFKDSAATVIKNSEKAYKTAGMSATEYMETVTSFSASLLQSLDGDTTKAAAAADLAVVDMSDNANKMGTDITAIQSAYQGFAKQNYTMLDNLKLGYGGTKTEMERLLADATKLSGVKYDISNLSDVYSAIHVIQTEIGITGTTSKEASTTIAGSVNMVKQKLSNFVVNMGSQLAPTVQKFLTFAIDNLPVVEGLVVKTVPVVSELLQTLLPPTMSLAQSILPMLVSLITTLLPPTQQILSAVLPVLIHLMQTLLPPLIQIVETILPPLLSILQPLISLLIPIIDLLTPILDLVVAVLQPLAELISKLLTPMIAVISALIGTALIPLQAVFTTLSGILSGTFCAAVDSILNYVNTLKGVFSGVIQFIKGVFTGDWKRAWQGIEQIFSSIWQGIKNAFKIPINWIIDGLNSFIRGINKIKIPDWVPQVGGKGFSIGEIPRLYSGGVLERGQVGMLEGTGAEAVVPLENNSKWIRAVARDMGTALNYTDDSAILERLDTLIALITMLIKLKQIPSADDLIGLLSSEVDRRLGKTLSFKERLVMT